jgi:hypothetical protein
MLDIELYVFLLKKLWSDKCKYKVIRCDIMRHGTLDIQFLILPIFIFTNVYVGNFY